MLFSKSVLILCCLGLNLVSCNLSPEKSLTKRQIASSSGTYYALVENDTNVDVNNFHEQFKIEIWQNKEMLDKWEVSNKDPLERVFYPPFPKIDWLNDNVLRLQSYVSQQPFQDEISVFNSTQENLRHIVISYGKSETFWIFDLLPGKQVKIEASPQFSQYESANSFVGFSGLTYSNRRFEGTVSSKRRTSLTDGPLKILINVDATRFRYKQMKEPGLSKS